MTQSSFAVIVGRFQVTDLHAGHQFLIAKAMKNHDQLLIVLASSGGQPTARNPLDTKTREQAIRETYPNAIIREIKDMPSDEVWSKKLDEMIKEVIGEHPAKIYGSRDCFIDYYTGDFETVRIPELPHISGTQARHGIGDRPINNRTFRQGIIYGAQNRFPTSYQTVDIIVHKRETGEILLGRKPGDDGWRFIGGFVDPTDESLEHAAKRECSEETGMIEIGQPTYVASTRVADHRYRGTPDGIMTTIFIAPYIFGAPRPTDDIAELTWIKIEDVEKRLMNNHQAIWNIAKQHLIDQGKL